MLLNLIIFAFASSQVAGTALSPNLLLAVSPSNVFRPNPCNQVAARQYEPNPRGCAWFWQCRDNDGNLLEPPQEEKCPYGLHFQASGPSCTYADDIDPICNFDEINRDIPSECAGHRPLPLLPHPFMCNKYLQCFSNLTIERECEPGMYFSFFDNECVPEALANCTIVDDYCKSFEVGRSTHRNAFSCTKFHVCSLCDEHYKIAELECSEPSHQYSDEFGHCTIDSNTNCTVSNETSNFISSLNFHIRQHLWTRLLAIFQTSLRLSVLLNSH